MNYLALVNGVDGAGNSWCGQGSLDSDSVGIDAVLTGALGELDLSERRVWHVDGGLDTDGIETNTWGAVSTLVVCE